MQIFKKPFKNRIMEKVAFVIAGLIFVGIAISVCKFVYDEFKNITKKKNEYK